MKGTLSPIIFLLLFLTLAQCGFYLIEVASGSDDDDRINLNEVGEDYKNDHKEIEDEKKSGADYSLTYPSNSKGKFDIHEFVAGHEFVPIGYEFVSTGYEFVPTEFLFLHISEIFFCRKFDIL